MLIKELTRINELARTARARPLTAAENDERARLRRAYLAAQAIYITYKIRNALLVVNIDSVKIRSR